MPYIPPISPREFLQHLQRCIPPGGWTGRLIVANSGGPDSICLLYLLASLLKDGVASGLPSDLLSVHVDHNIQAASTLMAEQAAESARLLGVPHLTLKIPWCHTPFPPNPAKSSAFEGICRDARLNRLAHSMTVSSASTIAFAHHADDQVETSIMRMASGSGKIGTSGMRPVRRWGMGQHENRPLTWMGETGMSRYIIRPLLEVSKDRILATCDANALQYVTDPTNSRPDVTLRNFVRDVLSRNDRAAKTDSLKVSPGNPFAHKMIKIPSAIHILKTRSSTRNGIHQLSDAVRTIGQQVQRTDTQVTNFLEQNLIPSPPTTLLLPSITLDTVKEPDFQTSLVRRILRHVSPQPWGHPSAEADGSRRALQEIANRLFKSRPISTHTSFTMGAKVWWRPVYLRGNQVGFGVGNRSSDHLAWLAQRERPWASTRLDDTGITDTLIKDVTPQLREALATGSFCSVLYDCRVVARFDMAACPPALAKALQADADTYFYMVPATPFHLPHIIMRKFGSPDMLLATYPWTDEQLQKTWMKRPLKAAASWITMSTVRTWDPW